MNYIRMYVVKTWKLSLDQKIDVQDLSTSSRVKILLIDLLTGVKFLLIMTWTNLIHSFFIER